jgi:acetyltransferase-like isoleucine patch superfamily enzyme
MIVEIIKRIKFWNNADRIGPDMLSTHWRLYFKTTMRKLCRCKFKSFGNEAEFRPGAYAESCSKIEIGANVVIRPGTFLYADPLEGGGEIIIEDDVLIAGGVHLYVDNHQFSDPNTPIINQGYQPAIINNSIRIKCGAWIGAGVIILPGVVVGENSVVSAGSVVINSIPPRVVVAGNPAKVIRKL